MGWTKHKQKGVSEHDRYSKNRLFDDITKS